MEVAPPFRLPDLRDSAGVVDISDFRGHPVVLNFFASWCPPCRREMPDFETAHQKLGGRVVFLGINHLDDRAAALQLLAETRVSYQAGYDPEGNVAVSYGLFGMPTTVFISPEGKILKRRTGAMSEAELESTIAALFPS